MDIDPDDLAAFIQAFKEKSSGSIAPPQADGEAIKNDKEETDENN
jgi:hypothetical protein